MTIPFAIDLAERGLVPTPLLRAAIRQLCRQRLAALPVAPGADAFLDAMDDAPVALVPEMANEQHYEVPSEFFQLALGRQLKYSSAVWPIGTDSLDAAEASTLALTCERADLRDGQEVLELGCGWGSLSLYVARRYPDSRITVVSNSTTQRAFLEARRPPNLTIVTADMNVFDPGKHFDRIVSVEMFEHIRDWRTLLDRVSTWLNDDGRLFIHVFCHRRHSYSFETEGASNWMGRHFFSGGIMPSFDLLPRAARHFALEKSWWIDGTHYQRTAAGWRENLECRRDAALAVLRAHYGGDAERWYQRWRMFFLACEELFGYSAGAEWGVGHYRLVKRASGSGGGSKGLQLHRTRIRPASPPIVDTADYPLPPGVNR